jgi:hypothetical protein
VWGVTERESCSKLGEEQLSWRKGICGAHGESGARDELDEASGEEASGEGGGRNSCWNIPGNAPSAVRPAVGLTSDKSISTGARI